MVGVPTLGQGIGERAPGVVLRPHVVRVAGATHLAAAAAAYLRTSPLLVRRGLAVEGTQHRTLDRWPGQMREALAELRLAFDRLGRGEATALGRRWGMCVPPLRPLGEHLPPARLAAYPLHRVVGRQLLAVDNHAVSSPGARPEDALARAQREAIRRHAGGFTWGAYAVSTAGRANPPAASVQLGRNP